MYKLKYNNITVWADSPKEIFRLYDSAVEIFYASTHTDQQRKDMISQSKHIPMTTHSADEPNVPSENIIQLNAD